MCKLMKTEADMRAMDKDTGTGGKGSNALGPMPEWDLTDL
jgi:hypothetical protein